MRPRRQRWISSLPYHSWQHPLGHFPLKSSLIHYPIPLSAVPYSLHNDSTKNTLFTLSRLSHRKRYGAAASTPRGRPPPVNTGGTPVPLEWGERARVRARWRQRRLYMLAQQEDSPQTNRSGRTRATQSIEASGSYKGREGRYDDVSSQGEGAAEVETAGGEGGARARSCVPWHLLDELDAEKTKLRVSEMSSVNRHGCVFIAAHQLIHCCEVQSCSVSREMDRRTDVPEVSSSVLIVDGCRVRERASACVASVLARNEFFDLLMKNKSCNIRRKMERDV